LHWPWQVAWLHVRHLQTLVIRQLEGREALRGTRAVQAAEAKAEPPVVAADRTQAAALVEAHQVDQRELQREAAAG